ncbi:DNA starvation/stationary phase protection protein [Hathewaya histolytica]|uniref:General stress protein 20U n=1 Tax=Hathewaya histolytica TaxID=1498 RepID=A0A4U9QUH7_HATHI|nr:DNA starvation/stationary phase protection protein [Hathewaya histolytica]VTQ82296.1 general stress protein 20U [Hathewaya histolytica]
MEKKNLERELNVYLANLNVLYTKLHNYHWNVSGLGFFELHTQYENFYNQTSLDLDQVAEVLLSLGYTPMASMKEYLSVATIKEREAKKISTKDSVKEVSEDFKVMLKSSKEILELAEEEKVQAVIDMAAAFIGNYEKTLWMLRAYLD